jgi:SAM-dependent methyltransferase
MARWRVLTAGTTLLRTGDPVRSLLLVMDGALRLTRPVPHGAALTLQRAGSGATLAEASVFAERYQCDAVAAERSILCDVPKPRVETALLVDTAPHFPRRSAIMGFYSSVVLPKLCHLAMRNQRLLPYRERVIGSADGRVLEIGIGSGLNLPFYRASVREVLGLEPSPQLIGMARSAAGRARTPVTFVGGSAEAIPLEDHSIDTLVTT